MDFAYVMQFVNDSIVSCAVWFISLLSNTNMTSTYLAWIFIMLVGRFFLMPILGAGFRSQGSDTVKKINANQSRGSTKGKSNG